MAGNVMQGKEMAVSIMEEVSATVRRLKAWHGKVRAGVSCQGCVCQCSRW